MQRRASGSLWALRVREGNGAQLANTGIVMYEPPIHHNWRQLMPTIVELCLLKEGTYSSVVLHFKPCTCIINLEKHLDKLHVNDMARCFDVIANNVRHLAFVYFLACAAEQGRIFLSKSTAMCSILRLLTLLDGTI